MQRAAGTLGDLTTKKKRVYPRKAKLTPEQRRERWLPGLNKARATFAAQRRGQTRIIIEYQGETLNGFEWAARIGITIDALRFRYRQHLADSEKWPLSKVLAPKMWAPKLTREQVAQVRAEAAAGASARGLAKKFGMDRNAMRAVIAGLTYK